MKEAYRKQLLEYFYIIKIKAMKTLVRSKAINRRILSIQVLILIFLLNTSGQAQLNCKLSNSLYGAIPEKEDPKTIIKQADGPGSSEKTYSKGPQIVDKTISLSIHSPAGKPIWDINDSETNTDKDPDGNEIFYLIVSGNAHELFDINQTTGEIMIVKTPDRNKQPVKSYNLIVYAGTKTEGDDALIEIEFPGN